MFLPWYLRRFVGVIIGLAVSLTFGSLWGPPFIRALAWLTGTSGPEAGSGAAWVTLPGMVLGGLLCSLPAAAVWAQWHLADAAERTGLNRDATFMEPLGSVRVKKASNLQSLGWLILVGLLVGMMMSAPRLLDSWWGGLLDMVSDAAPDLTGAQHEAVTAMVQAFPFAAAGMFVWSLAATLVPMPWNRWPGSDRWVPWRSLAVGALVWLACVLVSVLPVGLLLA